MYKQYYYAFSYHVGPLANAGIKYKAYYYVIFIPYKEEDKHLNVINNYDMYYITYVM